MHRLKRRFGIVAGFLLLLMACQPMPAPVQDAPAESSMQDSATPLVYAEFNDQRQLIRPEGYREEWIIVGTPLTPNDLNGGQAPFPEFHHVYIDPQSYQMYKETGEFPDGTILVKELISVGSKEAVSGNGYFMGDFLGLEATVKDSERFADEPGNWAYFSFGRGYPLDDTADAFPAAECNACHEASAEDDWVFTQYYPVLRAGRGDSPVIPNEALGAEEEPAAKEQAGEEATNAASEAAARLVPTSGDELFAYLQSGAYKSFAHESGVHISRGPHGEGGVITYLNPILKASLKAGNTTHPAQAATVKELYASDKETVMGWAVYVKTQDDGEEGKAWYWYEVLGTTDNSNTVADGMGVQLCVGCHIASDKDFVLSDFPLE